MERQISTHHGPTELVEESVNGDGIGQLEGGVGCFPFLQVFVGDILEFGGLERHLDDDKARVRVSEVGSGEVRHGLGERERGEIVGDKLGFVRFLEEERGQIVFL